MKLRFLVLLTILCALSAAAVEVTTQCETPGSWRISAETTGDPQGVEIVRVKLDSDVVAPPPKFAVKFAVPQVDIRHVWNAVDESYPIPADWSTTSFESQLAGPPPLYCFLNGNNRNRLTLSCSESSRVVRFAPLLHEEDSSIRVTWTFFERPEAGLRHYETTIRLDHRDGFWSDSVREASAWVEKASGCEAAVPPPAAFDPLYSTWYCFHQDVTDREIEAECRLAADAGMKTIILDDGWQTDDTNRGYGWCGDWEVSKRRFPDMAAHVAKVRQMGFKYMVWYSMPFVGFSSKAYPKFDGKYLYKMDRINAAVLDPRFPEVRDYLADVYEKAMREWNIDGFKFDFINRFTIPSWTKDPALATDYAGRDFKSVTAAVDCLMTNVMARLQAVKPDVLIEFRQPYFSTEIRKYCNMLRATDCPGDGFVNRMRTVNLRLVAGKTAVHADMLEWHPDETPEKAARYIVDSLFSVVQYSMMIRRLPESHRRMMTHWIDFQLKYRDTLLKGDFRAWHPEAGYPLVEANDSSRRIFAVYNPLTACELGADRRETLVVNGTGSKRLVVLSAVERRGEIVDTFGKVVASAQVKAGANVFEVPEAGYVRLNGIASDTLKVGFSRVDITPPLGSYIPGYYQSRRATAILDPLQINMLAFSDGNKTALLAQIDTGGLYDYVANPMRDAIAKATGVDRESILLHASHTHDGGYLMMWGKNDKTATETDLLYIRMCISRAADAAVNAIADLKPARLSCGRNVAKRISFGRRYLMKNGKVVTNPGTNNPDIVKPAGNPPDDEVQVLRIDREGGKPIAVINFQTHPDVVGGTAITADWPGLTRGVFEAATFGETLAVVINGTQGDLNHCNVLPRPGELNGLKRDFDAVDRGYDHARHMANVLAASALGVWMKCVPLESGAVKCAVEHVRTPVQKGDVDPGKDLSWAKDVCALHERSKREGVAATAADHVTKKYGWRDMELTTEVARACRICNMATRDDYHDVPLLTLAIGRSVAFATFPGEPFNDIGKAIKSRSPFGLTILACLTNGCRGYFPCADSFKEGGYESAASPFGPSVEGDLVEGELRLLQRLIR